MSRSILKLLLLATAATCLQAAHAADKIKVTMGWQPTMNGARFFLAEAQDLFNKEGLDVTLIRFNAGPPFFAAFQSGSIDVGFIGIPPAVTAIAQGIPVKVVAIENEAGGAEGLVARKDSGIKSLKDLRGKKVATRRGSSAYSALLAGLKQAGMTQADIQLVDLDVSALMPAFQKGDVDAAWYWEPWMGLLKRNGGHVVVTDRDIKMPVGIVWVARDQWLQKNGEAMQRLLRILDIAAVRIREQPREAARLVAKKLELTEEHVYEVFTKGATWPSNAESMADSYVFSMAPAMIAGRKGITGVMTDNANFQKESKVIQTVPDYTKAVDSTWLQAYTKKK
jgi:taurine transport system substrate-binding protein